MAKELAKRGYYFGFGGTSTYKNSQKVREVMQYIPKELMLFETDCPYLTPVPFRGKRNNPAYVEYTAKNAWKFYKLILRNWSLLQPLILSVYSKKLNKFFLKYFYPISVLL